MMSRVPRSAHWLYYFIPRARQTGNVILCMSVGSPAEWTGGRGNCFIIMRLVCDKRIRDGLLAV